METFLNLVRHALFICLCVSQSRCREPKCSSFDYEEKLLEKMVKMEFEVKHSLNEMQAFIEDVKLTLEDIREERNKLKEEIDGFRQTLNDVNRENQARIEENVRTQESALARLSDDVVNLRNITAVPTKAQRVEFKAQVVYDKTLGDGQAIVFSTVDINKGEGYNSKTGYFTAPVAGTYLLMVQICIKPTNYIFLDIVVDDVTKNAFQASGYHFNYCVTWMTFADMDMGSKAAVVSTRDKSSTNVFQETPQHQNYFSGILLYEKV